MFEIGSKDWPGLSKVVEECGEVLQVAGKLMGSKGDPNHFDGTHLSRRLEEELGDLLAAIDFFMGYANDISSFNIQQRKQLKYKLFYDWHINGLKAKV